MQQARLSPPPPPLEATALVARATTVVTTPPTDVAVTPTMGAAPRVGGFMQTPVLAPLAITHFKPRPAQQDVVPLVAVVQPGAPTPLQTVLGQRKIHM